MRWVLLSAILIGMSCATVVPIEVKTIRDHRRYEKLTGTEKDLVEEIMNKALKNNKRKDYYFSKLTLLLSTVTNPLKITTKKHIEEINRSVEESKKERREIAKKSNRDLEEYLTQEEFYENMRKRDDWKGYKPESGSPHFYIADEDPLDILVNIRVRLSGKIEMVKKIILLEDAIEKHLYVEGFSVNLVFVGHSETSEDIFDVDVDPSHWPTSHNWSGEHRALAHELLHLMGLPDEYHRIEAHAGNKNMSLLQRLYQFRAQMDEELPSDAKQGIMCYYWKKPLERHVCTAVGLGDDCVKARMEAFHSEE